MSSSNRSESQPAIIAVDQGTSSTKALAVAADGTLLARESVAIGQSHPQPGWVAQDASEILDSVRTVVGRLLGRLDRPVASLALSTQRESAIAWDRASGRPLGPMLGWQDRRTRQRALALRESGDADWIRQRTGLPVDPMFSALKLEWLLDSVDPDRSRSRRGEIALGTVDSYLAHRLTGRHVIEAGNASRTQLLDIDRVAWDDQLLECFRIPAAALPEVIASDTKLPLLADRLVGGGDGGRRGGGIIGDGAAGGGTSAPAAIDAILGDSHAALFGHGVRAPGQVKATYGTGSSVMGLLAAGAAPDAVGADSGLTRTIAWQLGDRPPAHAFEGNILASGATLVWAGQLLSCSPTEIIELARTAEALHGVNLVPAFAGLGAPWWSERAQATISGFTLGSSRRELARAAVDAVVLQIEDVLSAAQRAGAPVSVVLADGGPSANDWLMQLQADLSGRVVRRSSVAELSALGAATLAARSIGLAGFTGAAGAADASEEAGEFRPRLDPETAAARRASWRQAVARVLATDASPAGVDKRSTPAAVTSLVQGAAP